MNIAYLSYWGINDGLTKSTVMPHIKILSSFTEINKIYLFTIERESFNELGLDIQKVQHIPLFSKYKSFRLLNKISDFIGFPSKIKSFTKTHNIDLLICRGAPAGAIGLLALKNSSIPFIVESFEPHAEYMLESGVWSKNSLSYILEKSWEQKIKNKAKAILPVSLNYQKKLETEVISAYIILAPCAVNNSEFQFDSLKRELLRNQLQIDVDKTVGIYVGKFGDIYLKEEFFEILKSLQSQLKNRFYFIILSPQDSDEIESLLKRFNLDLELIKVLSVNHEEVPDYLSTADYGIATIRPSQHRKYCSPIKTGEYWANGLPILITEEIGDDSEIIAENNIGEIVRLGEINNSVKSFIEKLNSKSRIEWAQKIMPFAKKYRSFSLIEAAYHKILKEIEKG